MEVASLYNYAFIIHEIYVTVKLSNFLKQTNEIKHLAESTESVEDSWNCSVLPYMKIYTVLYPYNVADP